MSATTADKAIRTTRRAARRHRGEGGPLGVVAWLAALVFITPIAWMILTGFHHEVDAATNPPSLFAQLTLENYQRVIKSNILPYLLNSLMAAGFSTILVIVLALPMAYATAVKPIANPRGLLQWVLSTKFLPLIAALVPVYITFKQLGLLDNIFALVIFYTGLNLPIAVWMCHSFLSDIPADIMAAAEVDGASLFTILRSIVLPISLPGIAATSLICFIFAWNEFLFALNLTATKASTAPIFLVGFITSEGLFMAQLSAAAIIVSLPVVIAGWVAQDKLVQGLSLGAVK
ncbi:MAG: carbohydrate ABC transporter permease [Propionibacteriaceae bacterium]|nr:carbohydrate ABC transporter permease [Propionibacteriaceae bacterium]